MIKREIVKKRIRGKKCKKNTRKTLQFTGRDRSRVLKSGVTAVP